MKEQQSNLNICTLGYSTQSLTRILCSTSGLVKINLSMPIGPTTRTTGPYCLTHCRWGMPASPSIIFPNWPRIGSPRGGPGIERSGDNKYGYRISRWTIRYVMNTWKTPYTKRQTAMKVCNIIYRHTSCCENNIEQSTAVRCRAACIVRS